MLDVLKTLADCLQEENGRREEKPQREERWIRQQNNSFRFGQVTIYLLAASSQCPRETVFKCLADRKAQACLSSSKRLKVKRKEEDDREKREEEKREAEFSL